LAEIGDQLEMMQPSNERPMTAQASIVAVQVASAILDVAIVESFAAIPPIHDDVMDSVPIRPSANNASQKQQHRQGRKV
jgi:hypothetical protein